MIYKVYIKADKKAFTRH